VVQETADKAVGDALLTDVAQARLDVLDLYDYISRRPDRDMPFDAIVMLSPDKIATDPGITARLYELLAALSRAAAPVTPVQIRIAKAMNGNEAATPEISWLVRRLRLLRRNITVLGLVTVFVSTAVFAYAMVGRETLMKARDIQLQLATLVSDWQQAAITITSEPLPQIMAECAAGHFRSQSPLPTGQHGVSDLCLRTGELMQRRADVDGLLRFWNVTDRQQLVAGQPPIETDVAAAATKPPSNAIGAQQVIAALTTLLIPLTYGLLGATVHALRSLAVEAATTTLGWATPNRTLITVVFGPIAGLAVGSLFGAQATLSSAAVAFLAGYASPVFFTSLDKLIASVFRPGGDSVGWAHFNPLHPIGRTAHYVIGIGLAALFIFGTMLLPGAAALLPGMNFDFPKPDPSLSIMPYLALVGGSLGAWVHLNSDILLAIGAGHRTDGEPKVPLPLLRYVTGAFAGFIAGFLVPKAVLSQGNDIIVFNPFLLAASSLAAGYLFSRNSPMIVERFAESLTGPTGASAIEQGVRRALAPQTLLNYRGFLNCILRSSDLTSRMARQAGQLVPNETKYVLDVFFDPRAPDDALAVPIQIVDGADADATPFEIEIIALGFEPRRRRLEVSAPRAGSSPTAKCNYELAETVDPRSFRFTVTQAGRVIQFATLSVHSYT